MSCDVYIPGARYHFLKSPLPRFWVLSKDTCKYWGIIYVIFFWKASVHVPSLRIFIIVVKSTFIINVRKKVHDFLPFKQFIPELSERTLQIRINWFCVKNLKILNLYLTKSFYWYWNNLKILIESSSPQPIFLEYGPKVRFLHLVMKMKPLCLKLLYIVKNMDVNTSRSYSIY